MVFDKSASGPAADRRRSSRMPDAMLDAGYDRLLDFAYLKKGGVFVGLFASAAARQLARQRGDGAVRPRWRRRRWIDGGIWHGVGEFLP